MNELQVFNNPEFGEIRTLEINGEPWFAGKDIALALGYAKPTDAVRKLVDDEDRGLSKMGTPSGMQDLTIINESGLYSLVLSSKLPNAKKFKRWVTSEVLPSIRKTGQYSKASDTSKAALAEAKLNNSRARLASVWLKLAQINPIPEYQQICAHHASAVLAGREVLPLPEAPERTYTATEVGEMLGGVSANKVGRMANEHNLKTPEYGVQVWDKSPHSSKQVSTWRYNDKAVEKLRELTGGAA